MGGCAVTWSERVCRRVVEGVSVLVWGSVAGVGGVLVCVLL